QNDTATLALVKRLRRVRKRRRSDVFWPNQLLRPFLPLDEHPWDLSRPIWTESHRSRHRDHIGGRNGVADFVPVQCSRPSHRIGENLDDREARTDNGISRTIVLAGVSFVQFLD